MALLAKMRPSGPWRVGPDSGDRLRVGRVLHSDALYSALTHAFIELGEFDAWIEATAIHAAGPQVRLSSCFPFVPSENGDVLFLPPPQSLWPPADSLRIRWKSASYVPANAIWQLLGGKPLTEEHWSVDGVSECLLPVIRNVPAQSPFRITIRSRAAVDRLGQGVEPHQTACLEFSKGAGVWMAFSFADKAAESHWAPLLEGALKLIADSGLGGERSSGWGRFEQPEFVKGELGPLLFGNRYRAPEEITGHWLLSLFSPAADDTIDWQQGNYRVVARTGRVESKDGWGAAKRANQMIAEGGVLVTSAAPKGTARNVAPAGFPHPVYRAGFALTLPIGKPRPAQPKPEPKVVVDTTLLEALAEPPKDITPAEPPETPVQEPPTPAEPPAPAEPPPSIHPPEPMDPPPTEPVRQDPPEPAPPAPLDEKALTPAEPPETPVQEPPTPAEPPAPADPPPSVHPPEPMDPPPTEPVRQDPPEPAPPAPLDIQAMGPISPEHPLDPPAEPEPHAPEHPKDPVEPHNPEAAE
jgi:CRISPR type III-A-associated RAMP protein Csm4